FLNGRKPRITPEGSQLRPRQEQGDTLWLPVSRSFEGFKGAIDISERRIDNRRAIGKLVVLSCEPFSARSSASFHICVSLIVRCAFGCTGRERCSVRLLRFDQVVERQCLVHTATTRERPRENDIGGRKPRIHGSD